MRLQAYAGTSTVLAAAVVLRAFHQRANFYSAAVYLAQSNACLMILTNLLLLMLSAGMVALQRLLYGPLRPIEIEQLYEKAWFAITETCLAMTIFRDEVGGWFLVMFVALLMGKVWGWIGEGRVEVLEQQPPANPRLFHARLSFSLLLSMTFDLALLRYAVNTVLQMARPNMMVMFAFEFAVLTISSSSTSARYAISLVEAYIVRRQTQLKLEERRTELRTARAESRQRTEPGPGAADAAGEEVEVDEVDIDVPGWEDKGQWVLYLDLVTDFLKLVVYLSFFFILLTFYGLPIHIMRDVFLTLRSFIKRISDFLRYRRATRDMNARYPDATAAEISREEVCIICREEMRPWPAQNQRQDGAVPAGQVDQNVATSRIDERSRPKKLPCGHILHFGCLRSWLERQQICPTCRRPVMVTDGAVQPTGNAAAVNAAPGQANDAGRLQRPHEAARNPAGPAPAAQGANGQNRGRVVNFGPFRIGFGMGQEDVFQNLAQQLHNGQAGQLQQPNTDGQGDNARRQQIGLGMGFGRVQRPEAQQGIGDGPLSDQSPYQSEIQHLEQQINDEIATLRASADQLRLVQTLQGELIRLRQVQADPGRAVAGSFNPTPWAGPEFRPNLVPGQAHVGTPQQSAMGSGHPGLPPNMTLPPGWSILPLTRVDAAVVGQQAAPMASVRSLPTMRTPSASTSPNAPTPSSSTVNGRRDQASASNQQASDTTPFQGSQSTKIGIEESREPLSTTKTSNDPSSKIPAVQSATGPAPVHESRPDSVAHAHHEEPAISTTSIPSWGSTPSQAGVDQAIKENGSTGPANVLTNQNQPSSTESHQSKGKAKAASVEDFLDDAR